MLKIFLKTIVPIVVVLLISTWCHAYQPKQQQIKIICGYKFPPFYTVTSKKDPSKNLTGTFIDLMNVFQKNYPQYNIEYKCMPRARVSKLLIRGEADGYALTDPMFLPEQAKSKYLPSLPMWTISDHLLVLKDSPIIKTDFEDMIGRTIAVLHGNDHGPLNPYFENELIKQHSVYSTKQILELLLKKRVDAAICNKITLPGLVKETPYSMAQFRILDKALYSFKLHLVVHRKNSAFLNDFNEYLKKSSLTMNQ
ncbi:ABC transporter substrate-binding protein [Desulfovibrio sp. JC022]|uniref:substrate-binding periplasmic protein n=1 Tax=Desulfovibrio sp. JC022 TaxID=2593642 RepID=UPI0013D02ACF|nr:transporter substrate-binding domain-containing protein [Desulfovibrio sp. JC022]NDV22887.1 transporter substrate-binding domain-containing protein [Desulfovibrio sp. JC022]